MSALTTFFRTPEIAETLRNVDSRALDRRVNDTPLPPDQVLLTERLRLAAIASFSEMLGTLTIDRWLRNGSPETMVAKEVAEECFADWQGFLNSLVEINGSPNPDDLLSFTVCGFLASKPHEVRDALRRLAYRQWVSGYRRSSRELPWLDRVRTHISLAVILMVRQDDRADIEEAGVALRELANFQRRIEAEWLDEQQDPRRDALVLLAFYHLAEAVIRISEFLLSGSVIKDGRAVIRAVFRQMQGLVR